jgi:hypothetical protein
MNLILADKKLINFLTTNNSQTLENYVYFLNKFQFFKKYNKL